MTRSESCIASEEWRDVPNFEGLYQVSSTGFVRSCDRASNGPNGSTRIIKGRILKERCTKVGNHPQVMLFDSMGNKHSAQIDRLVIDAFADGVDEGKYIYHIDGNYHNSAISNLLVVSPEEFNKLERKRLEELDASSNTGEIWKDIPGTNGYYQASDRGDIRSVTRMTYANGGYKVVQGRILSPRINDSGYYEVVLSIDGKKRSAKVHRLVAMAFLDNSDNLPEVDHIDSNRTNNDVRNLRWVTSEENNRHICELGHHRTNYEAFYKTQENRMAACRKPVMRNDGVVYKSVADASRALGYKTTSMVSKQIRGQIKTCKGYTFTYA